jgi:hypothetical protein
MIDQPTEKRNHSDQTTLYAKQYHFVPVTELGLHSSLDESASSLSAEVFRLQVLPRGVGGCGLRQMAVLYLEGTAGASYPGGPIIHDDLPDPVPVAIVEIHTTVCLMDLMEVDALYDAVEKAALKLADKELEQARKVIDRLTGRG